MLHPTPHDLPAWYHPYLALVTENEKPGRLLSQTWDAELPFWRSQKNPELPYAPGKWSLCVLVQHLVDTERIFQTRALRAAREDGVELPDFDHEAYAQASQPIKNDYYLLLKEWSAVRQAGSLLFDSFGDKTLAHKGQLSKGPVTVLAIAYIMVGHARHHLEVVRHRLA